MLMQNHGLAGNQTTFAIKEIIAFTASEGSEGEIFLTFPFLLKRHSLRPFSSILTDPFSEKSKNSGASIAKTAIGSCGVVQSC